MKLHELKARIENTPLRDSLDFLFQQVGAPMYFETPIGFLEIVADAIGVTHAVFVDKIPSGAHIIKSIEPLNINMSHGTKTQQLIWKEVCKIPKGETRSYGDIAKALLGRGVSARTVGNAMAKNRIAYIIPCHRVIKSDGQLGGYYWGLECKKKLLEWEKQNAV